MNLPADNAGPAEPDADGRWPGVLSRLKKDEARARLPTNGTDEAPRRPTDAAGLFDRGASRFGACCATLPIVSDIQDQAVGAVMAFRRDLTRLSGRGVETAIWQAAVTEYLLDQGASMNGPGYTDKTALGVARARGVPDVTSSLKYLGANSSCTS